MIYELDCVYVYSNLFVVIDVYEYHMDMCKESCFSICSSVLLSKNLTLDTMHKLFN